MLEEQGLVDHAEEAYWTNIDAKSTDRRSYDRLIAIYKRRGDKLSASLVQRKLDEMFNFPTPKGAEKLGGAARTVAHVATPPTPERPARPMKRLRGASAERADNPRLGSPPPPPLDNRARRAAAAQPLARPAAARPTAAVPAPAAPSSPSSPPLSGDDALAQAAARLITQGGSRPQTMARRHVAPEYQPIEQHGDVVADVVGMPRSRRRGNLLPNPGGQPFHFGGSGLIALQPMTIAAFVLASFGAAAIISIMVLALDRGGAKTASAAPLNVPARCADGAQRFPGANDPRAAVVAAYKQQGIDVDTPRPGGPRVTPEQAELVVGGWMAASLLLEHAGQPAPTLVQWLDPAADKSTLANAILSGRGLDSMLSADEWRDARAWPATTCEGAFLKDSRNDHLVRLIERVVSK